MCNWLYEKRKCTDKRCAYYSNPSFWYGCDVHVTENPWGSLATSTKPQDIMHVLLFTNEGFFKSRESKAVNFCKDVRGAYEYLRQYYTEVPQGQAVSDQVIAYEEPIRQHWRGTCLLALEDWQSMLTRFLVKGREQSCEHRYWHSGNLVDAATFRQLQIKETEKAYTQHQRNRAQSIPSSSALYQAAYGMEVPLPGPVKMATAPPRDDELQNGRSILVSDLLASQKAGQLGQFIGSLKDANQTRAMLVKDYLNDLSSWGIVTGMSLRAAEGAIIAKQKAARKAAKDAARSKGKGKGKAKK